MLGTVRRCPTCCEWWPDDHEFFYTPPPSSHGRNQCRACISEIRADRPTPKRPATHGDRLDQERKRRRDNERKAALRRDPVFGAKLRERERLSQQRYYERHSSKERARMRDYYARRRGGPPRPGIGRPRIDDERAA